MSKSASGLAAGTSIRYRSRRPDDAPLRQRLRELAADRLTVGVKRLTTLLWREGAAITHERFSGVYREEGLRKLRRRAAVGCRGWFRSTDVVDVLIRIAQERDTHPGVIQCDNGTEIPWVALDHWAYWNYRGSLYSARFSPANEATLQVR